MKKIKDITDGEIANAVPESLLKRLREVSNGGFILITLDPNGNAIPYKVQDDGAYGLALERAVELYIQQRDLMHEKNFILNSLNEVDQGDDPRQ